MADETAKTSTSSSAELSGGELRNDSRQRDSGASRRLSSSSALPAAVGEQASHGGDLALGVKVHISNAFEALFVSQGGGVLVVGWVDDLADEVKTISVIGSNWRVIIDGKQLARVRRSDVEASLGRGVPHSYGYLGLSFSSNPIAADGYCQIDLLLRSGAIITVRTIVHLVQNEQIRDTCLSYLIGASYYGNAHIRAVACLEGGVGSQILKINGSVVGSYTASPYVERFGDGNRKIDASMVVCIFGRAEYVFLQCALYSALPCIQNYEIIYVLNSPEQSERILSEARICNLIYDAQITVVVLSGNAGFSGANNVAASVARSDRLVIVNPDVFPKDRRWAENHLKLIEERPKVETEIFGAPLFYDDGSLMHGGMHFKMDRGVTAEGGKNITWQLLRVEHYGKGSPPSRNPYTLSRPVPAVTGAFISCRRGWFERLGGFSQDYVFGHYEDADLCLKSLEAGTPTWLHNGELWHLEGKGSTRLPVHEGGSLVNRWVFTSRWGGFISDGVIGPEPTHPLLKVPRL